MLLVNRNDVVSRAKNQLKPTVTPSPCSNSFARASYACAPAEAGEYAETGSPYDGASASRMLRGTMLLKTCPGKWLLTSFTTSWARFVRGSYIVRMTPRTRRPG